MQWTIYALASLILTPMCLADPLAMDNLVIDSMTLAKNPGLLGRDMVFNDRDGKVCHSCIKRCCPVKTPNCCLGTGHCCPARRGACSPPYTGCLNYTGRRNDNPPGDFRTSQLPLKFIQNAIQMVFPVLKDLPAEVFAQDPQLAQPSITLLGNRRLLRSFYVVIMLARDVFLEGVHGYGI
ncbi:predicted protein [Uncinocarpus reesii 1704]|uniref:Granulins domain-containing protein n=1 Tax=Uncinocarpus reesii (strain UAMH 1704) TaxID=336963 RepID=C4JD81_UNCRE|nr:uncharacterized protein UREG_00282 [Uncinocarpus reesii 1704]EEP75436.1 predicted protein [Uncinocarpus reesii 1704]